MTRSHYLILVCLLCCVMPVSAFAAGTPGQDNNIRINADRMSQSRSDGIYTAEGNVVVLWQGTQLVADTVRLSSADNLLHATGSVVLTKGSTVLKGETAVMNMESGRAEMVSSLLTVPDSNVTVASEKLIRINENEFTADVSELTSCDMPGPAWKFGTENLSVNLLGYATGKNVIFYVKDIPVLYIPWIAFPVVLEKRSGLLFPHFGYSKSRGYQLGVPAYLVISPSQDLQLNLDVMSRRGVGTGLDYRYIRRRGSEGHISAYPIYDQVEDRWRGQLAQEHTEIFAPDANLRMTINATSDRLFLNDFGEKSGDYNRQSNDTIINALKSWPNYAVTAYLHYNENLYAADNRTTVQTVPSFGVSGVRHQLFSLPLYADIDSSVDNLYRETTPSGQRLSLFPRITLLPMQNSFLHTTLFAGAHIRAYSTDRRDSTSDTQTRDGDLLPEAGIRLSTSLSRIYTPDFQQLKKIRHEIIPGVSYGFIPERAQQRLPFYDYTDRMIYRNMLSLSVTNLINGKFIAGGTSEYREISRIKIAAQYSFAGERRDLLTLVESQRSWSDLLLESKTWLTKLLKITFDSRYNIYENRLSTVEAGVEVDDRQGNSLGAAYQMARNEVEYFEGRLSTRLIRPFSFSYTARYSFDRSDFLESVYAGEYRHKCWSINLAIHQRPGNQSYSLNFTLAGLGTK